MRLACLLVLLAACDFQPPSKTMSAPAKTAPAAITPARAAPTAPPVAPSHAAGAAQPMHPASGPQGAAKACTDVAVKIAQILIDDKTDLSQKAALEQDRTKIVKKITETCTRDSWSQQVLDCLTAAKTQDDTRACTNDLKSP